MTQLHSSSFRSTPEILYTPLTLVHALHLGYLSASLEYIPMMILTLEKGHSSDVT